MSSGGSISRSITFTIERAMGKDDWKTFLSASSALEEETLFSSFFSLTVRA
jgi:hypothetical protein